MAAVILQRGRYLEEVEALKRRSFHWCYKRTPANCVRVDAEWNPDELRGGKPSRESDRLGESLCTLQHIRLTALSSQVIGCCRRAKLSSRKLYDTRGPEGGRYIL